MSVSEGSRVTEADLFGGVDLRGFGGVAAIGVGGADCERELHLKLLLLQQIEIGDLVLRLDDDGAPIRNDGGRRERGSGGRGSVIVSVRRQCVVIGTGVDGGSATTDVKLSQQVLHLWHRSSTTVNR